MNALLPIFSAFGNSILSSLAQYSNADINTRIDMFNTSLVQNGDVQEPSWTLSYVSAYKHQPEW